MALSTNGFEIGRSTPCFRNPSLKHASSGHLLILTLLARGQPLPVKLPTRMALHAARALSRPWHGSIGPQAALSVADRLRRCMALRPERAPEPVYHACLVFLKLSVLLEEKQPLVLTWVRIC